MPRTFFIGGEDLDLVTPMKRANAGLSWDISDVWSVDLKAGYEREPTTGTEPYATGMQANGNFQLFVEHYSEDVYRSGSVGASSTYKLDHLGLKDSFITASALYQDFHNYILYRLSPINGVSPGIANLAWGEKAISDFARSANFDGGNYTINDQKFRYMVFSTQTVIKPIDWLSVLAGLSYSDPTVESQTVLNTPHVDFSPGGQVSYRGGLTVEPVRGLNFYASYSESFNPQRRIDINDRVLPPLLGKQYELGTKYLVPGGRLLLTAALFDLRQANKEAFDRKGADGNDRYRAIGEVRSRGVELEAVGSVTNHWQVNAGFTYLDADVTKDANPANVGATRPWLPEKTASLFTTYEQGRGLSISGGVRYVDSVSTSFNNSTRPLDSYTLVDGSVGYAFDKWRVQLNVKNIFDETYYINSWQTLAYGLYAGEPRSYAVSLRKDF